MLCATTGSKREGAVKWPCQGGGIGRIGQRWGRPRSESSFFWAGVKYRCVEHYSRGRAVHTVITLSREIVGDHRNESRGQRICANVLVDII